MYTECSTHQKPHSDSTDSNPFEELNPGQAVSVELEHSHHQIKELFMLANQEKTFGSIELLNLF